MKAPDLLRSNDRIELYYREGTSGDLLITFAPRGHKSREPWAARLASKRGASVLGFVDRAEAWFPPASMAPLLDVARTIVKKHSIAVAYGHSMGGYGAARYWRELGAFRCFATAPQFSIEPKHIAEFDERRVRLFYNPEKHDGSAITEASVSKDLFILYDPHDAVDKEHVALFPRGFQAVLTIFAGHRCADFIAESRRSSEFASMMFNREATPAMLRGWYRSCRRNSPVYWRFRTRSLAKTQHVPALFDAANRFNRLAPSALSRSFLADAARRMSGDLIETSASIYVEQAESEADPVRLAKIARNLVQLKKHQDAVRVFQKVIENDASVATHLEYANALVQAGRIVDAINEAARIQAQEPRQKAHLSRLYLRLAQFEQARQQAIEALQIDPTESIALKTLQRLPAD